LLNTHAPLLSSLIAYPLPTFPGREQPSILHALLRKKLEPVVEEWIEEGRVEGVRAVGGDGDGDLGGGEDGVGRGVLELWGWAGMAANVEARRHDWEGAEFTREEREGVGGWEDRVIPPMRMEDVLRFMARGEEVKT
jgi:mediator of RNA polymerase II transcription subunit 8